MYSSETSSSFRYPTIILLSLPTSVQSPFESLVEGYGLLLSRFTLPKLQSKHMALQAGGLYHEFLPRDLNGVCKMKDMFEVILNQWLPLEKVHSFSIKTRMSTESTA